MFLRQIQTLIESDLHLQKVSMVLGARRVGKTEVLYNIFEKYKDKALWLNGEDEDVLKLLDSRTEANYRRILGDKTLLIIDEAQYIPQVSIKAKLMIDTIKPLHIILSGSSSFDLVQDSEPLVGRNLTYQMYPLAQAEWAQKETYVQTKQNLEDRLIYGSYPELSSFKTNAAKAKYLKEIVNTYLLKDILSFEQLKSPQKLKDLLSLLAFQIGKDVSYDELAKQLGISKNTVERYLDLLTKVFAIYRRSGYANNLRKEVVKSKRWYFVDNGIRNAIINDFRPLAVRQDLGMLWEQYVLNERLKFNNHTDAGVDSFFWRTYDQQEIDLIEAKDGTLNAFECKWKEDKVKTPVAFAKAYPDATFKIINQENYLDWLV